MKLEKKKSRVLLLTFIYRLHKILPFSKWKFKLFLNLEWIFDRLSHEMSFKFYTEENHPLRTHSMNFIDRFIKKENTVFDFGCKYGILSYLLAARVKNVIAVDIDKAAIAEAKKRYSV